MTSLVFYLIFIRIDDADDDKFEIEVPEIPSLLAAQLSDVESLNGLAEKYVAVESIIFVVDQFRRIRNIIDQLVQDENGQIENYFSQVRFCVSLTLSARNY